MNRPPVRGPEVRWTGVRELLVPVEVARRALLEPQTVVLGRLLEELRGVLQHVLAGLLGLLARVGERLLGRHLVALVIEPRIGLRSGLRRGRLERLDVERLALVAGVDRLLDGLLVNRLVGGIRDSG